MNRRTIIDLLQTPDTYATITQEFVDMYTLKVYDAPKGKPLWGDFECPATMTPHVREVVSGEYDSPVFTGVKTVVDVGANVGAFSYWAKERFGDDIEIHAYEPVASNYDLLVKNVPGIKSHKVAITTTEATHIYLGANNCGEASLFKTDEQTSEQVPCESRHPSCLPAADLLKLDTEGCEVDILTSVPLTNYRYIVLEYHSESDRRTIDTLLKDFILVGSNSRRPHRGVVKYARA